MDEGEFWLLHSVSERRQSLSILLMENLEAWIDGPAHGLTREALLERLFKLADAKTLEGFDAERGTFPLTHEDIVAGIDGTLDADYGLTELGGAVWEKAAQADWNKYIDGTFAETDSTGEIVAVPGERVGEFISVDKERLALYLSGLHFDGIAIYPPSLVWDEIKPWPATYWKELPSGHRARFCCAQTRRFPQDEIPDWFKNWERWQHQLA